jgi:DNA-binding LacI/PurR family transcriptional regulator
VLGFIQPDISHPYFNSLFLAAEQHALELGYTIILGNTLNDNTRHLNNMETHYMRLMEEKHVDGVLIAGGRIHDVESAQDYMDEFRTFLAATPVVTVSGRLQLDRVSRAYR